MIDITDFVLMTITCGDHFALEVKPFRWKLGWRNIVRTNGQSYDHKKLDVFIFTVYYSKKRKL